MSMAAIEIRPTRSYFSFRRVFFCTLPLLVLVLWIVALSSLATAGGTATASSPARVSVQVPPAAKSAGVVMLELSVSVSRKPASGNLGAVVRLQRPGGGATEVGRVSIVGNGQSYQFNVGSLPGGTAEVEVALIDRGGGPAPSGAELAIGRVEIVTR